MCDSRRPLNGADSQALCLRCQSVLTSNINQVCDGCYQNYPVWPQRAANEGWDSPETPPSARALVGAGARGGE